MAAGVELATAWVRLVPSMSGVQGAISQQLAPASAIADAEGKKAGKKFTAGFGLNIKTMATLAGGAIALGVAKWLKDSAEAVKEWQVINAQTAAVVKSTGGAAKITAKEVHKLADSIEGVTAMEAESIQKGANMLLTFKNIRNEAGQGNDIFTQSTKILVDMATAMGTDAPTAAIQLGKALNDPVLGISALSRVGIQFTEDQKKVITSLVEAGDTMGAQKIILAELQSQFGGSGVAYAETFAGKMALVQDSIGEIGEKIITMAMPHLTEMADWMLTTGIPRLQEFHDWIVDNKDVLGPAAIAVGVLTGAMWGLNLAMAANPVGLITTALVLLIGIIAWAVINWDSLTATVDGFAKTQMAAFPQLSAGYIQWFSQVRGFQGKLIAGYTEWFGHVQVGIDRLSAGFTWFSRTVQSAFYNILPIIRDVINHAIDLVNGVIGRINGVTGALKAATGGAINLTVGRIPRLAQGGIAMPVPGGHLVNVAEAGKPEAIVPLDRWDDFTGGDGDTAPIQMTNNIITREEDARVLARGLSREFADQIAGRRR